MMNSIDIIPSLESGVHVVRDDEGNHIIRGQYAANINKAGIDIVNRIDGKKTLGEICLELKNDEYYSSYSFKMIQRKAFDFIVKLWELGLFLTHENDTEMALSFHRCFELVQLPPFYGYSRAVAHVAISSI